MTEALADLIIQVAAPIYAALLERHWTNTRENIPLDVLSQYRALAITQALALRLDALETPV